MMCYYYYLQFPDEETEAQKISNLPKIIQLGCSTDRVCGRVTNSLGLLRIVLVLILYFCILGKPSLRHKRIPAIGNGCRGLEGKDKIHVSLKRIAGSKTIFNVKVDS